MDLPVRQHDALPELKSPTGGLEQPTNLVSFDLDRIIADLPNGFATFDRQWRYTYANNRLLEIFKLSHAEVIGKRAWDVFPHQVSVEFFDLLHRAMTERVEAQFEYYYELVDCWVEHRVYPTADGLAILMADISERKQAEFLLLEQQQLLELTASGTPMAECLAAVCASVSKLSTDVRACILLADPQRETFNDCIAPTFPASLCQRLEGAPIDELTIGTCGTAVNCGRAVTCTDIAGDESWSQEWRDSCLAHGVLGCHSAPILNADDVPLGSLMLCFDTAREPTEWEYQLADFGTHIASIVFERDRSNQALRESEARYRTLFESMDEGYVLMDLIFDAEDRPVDLYYLEANPAAVAMIGINPIGLRASDVYNVESHWMEILGRVAKTGIGERHELHFNQLDTWYNFYVFKIGDADSRRVAFIYDDVTERKRREANIAFLTEIQDEFTRLVSADEIMQTVGAKIGAYLNVAHCLFAEIDAAQDEAVFAHDWHTADAPSLVGVYQLSALLSDEFQQAARAKETIVINDTQTDARVDANGHAALNIYTFVSVPFHSGNEWKYLLTVNDTRSRDWRKDEIELVSELANRIFPRLKRARAEATVAANLRDTQLLRDLGARLVTEDDTQTLYREILATAIALTGADAGTVQIFDDRSQDLVLIESQGFDRQMTERFARVNASSNTPCGLAMRHEERIFVYFDVPESEDPDGSMRLHVEAGYLSAQSTPLISRTGKPLGMISTHWRSRHRPIGREVRSLDLLARQAADSIEQQQTAAALRESEAQLRMASDAAKVGMWFWNLETDCLIFTEQCKAVFGLPAETEISYAVFEAALHPDDRDRTQAAVTRSMEDRTDYNIEYRSCWSDGSVHWLSAKGSCSYDPTGKPVRMMGVVIDINDLKQAEAALRESEAKLRFMLDASQIGEWDLDLTTQPHTAHRSLIHDQIFGYGSLLSEWSYEIFLTHVHPEDRAGVDEKFQQTLTEGTDWNFECRIVHADSSIHWIWARSSVYCDSNGTPTRLLGMVVDFTDRKQMEIALAERNQELDSFVYIVSHDLKAPLRAISNLSVWIEEDLGTDLPAEIGQQMTQLRGRVQRMEAMINGLLDYARVGGTDAQIQLVSVTKLLADILDSIAPPPTFEIVIPSDLPTFHTKRLLLSQVFTNLIGNAFKHHDQPEGCIQISYQERGDFYEFAVSDDGPGIVEEQRDRVFIIFQSANPQKNPDSTGIGLSIVKKIVETAGGQIRLESELGKGTTFYFTWPK